jgi:thiamine-phosphate pyrophosphorylase
MQALALARLHAARGALLIVNDDPALAANVGADGVHLGEDDASIMSARELLGPDRIIGVSCYNDFDRARAAVDAGADYVAFGSFFPSSTKPSARRADLELLRRARSLDVPVVAIGGIDADNARTLIDAGADAVAVITAVFLHDDPADVRAAAESIVARMGVHQ